MGYVEDHSFGLGESTVRKSTESDRKSTEYDTSMSFGRTFMSFGRTFAYVRVTHKFRLTSDRISLFDFAHSCRRSFDSSYQFCCGMVQIAVVLVASASFVLLSPVGAGLSRLKSKGTLNWTSQ